MVITRRKSLDAIKSFVIMHKHDSPGKPFESKVSSSRHVDFYPNNYQMMNSRHIPTHRLFFLSILYCCVYYVCVHTSVYVCVFVHLETRRGCFPFLRQGFTM